MRQQVPGKNYLRSNVIAGIGFTIAALALLVTAAFLTRDHVSERLHWMTEIPDSVAIRDQFAASPALSPEESIEKMQIVDGFEVKLVAAEPLVVAPVALTFDRFGRMWVVEMKGYMPDTTGRGEDRPIGSITILDDQDGDGEAAIRKVFLDSLVMPRAISFIEDGILVAEPPNLWFVEIKNDLPGKKTLVDDEYAKGGNAEHQPNGLIHALDNWIYNAKSNKRYKKKGEEWLIESTHSRGQWGISQDNYGRLFYNHNSTNLLGDYYPPGLGATNSNQRNVAGFSEQIVRDKRVYPARPTTGVNRAYKPGFLDPWLRIKTVTAACSPVVYRGGLFGGQFDRNAFVAEPSANLVKRNIIEGDGYPVEGRQAYSEKEFLASTDERFRPVSLYNGPDGALYIVDMYRGIIQHKAYLTDYLKGEIKRRDLVEPLDYGRIYKVVPANKQARKVVIPEDPDKLVTLLEHPNGWARDKAQQILVEGKYNDTAAALRKLLKSSQNTVAQVHALWTLEGLGLLQAGDVLPLLEHPLWPVRMNALSALPSAMDKHNFKQCLPVLESMLTRDTLSAPLIAFTIPALKKFDKLAAEKLLHDIMRQFPDNEFVADAVISNVEDMEADFLEEVEAFNPDPSLSINKRLRAVLNDIRDAKNKKKLSMLKNKFPEGFALYNQTCQTCHGADGNGIKSLAPPLNRSEWVNGDGEKLASIVLFGLTGPVTVNGKLYDASEISGDMPGIGSNEEVSNEELAQLLSFIRASWSNSAGEVNAGDIARVRKKHEGRKDAFTVDDLTPL
jgi:mono/diheme cytochrome c family protein/glucose/arabinose dehydrogenase